MLADREALVRSAVTLKVTPDGPAAAQPPQLTTQNGTTGQLVNFTVQVRNNLLAHTFPTGFAFARQFWLEVWATGPNNEPVCLSAPFFAADGTLPVATPCTSGVLGVDPDTAPADAIKKATDGPSPDDTQANLLQCQPADVASTLGLDSGQMLQDQAQGKAPVDTTTGIEMQNLDVHLNGTAPVTGCDPWLTNFQKILTDGDPQAKAADDPTQTETSQEVAYQSFVPNLVHVRGRVADGQLVTDLQPVRLAPDPTDPSKLDSQDTDLFQYTFLVPNGVDPNSVVVNAKMEFRNIPPYFVTQLAQDQRDVLAAGFNVPEDAAHLRRQGSPVPNRGPARTTWPSPRWGAPIRRTARRPSVATRARRTWSAARSSTVRATTRPNTR